MSTLGIFFIALPFLAVFLFAFKELGVKYLILTILITAAMVGSIYLGCYLLNGHV